MTNKTAAFLAKHNFNTNTDVNAVTKAILFDMDEGLKGNPAGQDMIRTYANPPSKTPANKSVIVIDAGGTNFRSCLVTFDADSNATISDMEKTKMPGTTGELSKVEFFNQFADNIEHLKNKAEGIGFCFSYPMTITKDGDGILSKFTKEVKAPEVEGCKIGEELLKVLKARGWTTIKTVKLLNDTVAALLAGAADASKTFSSYIGFILGTGLNAAYIQNKCDCYKDLEKQIIVCESGKCDKLSMSDFDIALDSKSASKGMGLLEKQCSGAYLGPLSYEVLHTAAEEKLFAEKTNAQIAKIENLTLIEVNTFLHAPLNTDNVLGNIAAECNEEDLETICELLDAVVERSARNTAAIISACVIKSGEGKSFAKPVCVLCNGTTFFKTFKIKERVTAYIEQVLCKERNLNYEICEVENDITIGTAIGGLID